MELYRSLDPSYSSRFEPDFSLGFEIVAGLLYIYMCVYIYICMCVYVYVSRIHDWKNWIGFEVGSWFVGRKRGEGKGKKEKKRKSEERKVWKISGAEGSFRGTEARVTAKRA